MHRGEGVCLAVHIHGEAEEGEEVGGRRRGRLQDSTSALGGEIGWRGRGRYLGLLSVHSPGDLGPGMVGAPMGRSGGRCGFPCSFGGPAKLGANPLPSAAPGCSDGEEGRKPGSSLLLLAQTLASPNPNPQALPSPVLPNPTQSPSSSSSFMGVGLFFNFFFAPGRDAPSRRDAG